MRFLLSTLIPTAGFGQRGGIMTVEELIDVLLIMPAELEVIFPSIYGYETVINVEEQDNKVILS